VESGCNVGIAGMSIDEVALVSGKAPLRARPAFSRESYSPSALSNSARSNVLLGVHTADLRFCSPRRPLGEFHPCVLTRESAPWLGVVRGQTVARGFLSLQFLRSRAV